MSFDPMPNTPSSAKKFYYFMPCCTVVYEREGSVKQRMMNVVVQLTEKEFSYPAINQARAGCIQRVQMEMDVKPEEVKDFMIHSINPLGFMSQPEFEGQAPKTRKSQRN